MKTVSNIQLKSPGREAIDAAVRALKQHFPVVQVILYGSKAKGTDDSELDISVPTSRGLSWREQNAITDTLFDIELDHDVVINTLVVPQVEWTTGFYSVLPIYDEVKEHGVAA